MCGLELDVEVHLVGAHLPDGVCDLGGGLVFPLDADLASCGRDGFNGAVRPCEVVGDPAQEAGRAVDDEEVWCFDDAGGVDACDGVVCEVDGESSDDEGRRARERLPWCAEKWV